MTDDETTIAVLGARLDHLEPRVEHVHTKAHGLSNDIIGIRMDVSDLRRSAERASEDMEDLRAMTMATVEAANALASKAAVDRERFKQMQATLTSVLNSIRAVAVGSVVVVVGAYLTDKFVQ